MTDSTGHSGLPLSSQALPDLVAKGRQLGLTDQVLAIQLQLTLEELTWIASGAETWMAAWLPEWQKRVRPQEMTESEEWHPQLRE